MPPRGGQSRRASTSTFSWRPAPGRARPTASPTGWRRGSCAAATGWRKWPPSRSRAKPRRSFAAGSSSRSSAACRPPQGEERLRLERALADLEHLFAGTIHSFCAHLLRERPVEAGIAPGFSELDELEDQEARQRAWRDYLAQLRGQQSPLLGALQRARVRPQDLDRAFSTVCTFDEVTFPAGSARRARRGGGPDGGRGVLEEAPAADAEAGGPRVEVRGAREGPPVRRAAAQRRQREAGRPRRGSPVLGEDAQGHDVLVGGRPGEAARGARQGRGTRGGLPVEGRAVPVRVAAAPLPTGDDAALGGARLRARRTGATR